MQKTSKRRGWYPAPLSVYFPPSWRTELEKLAKTKDTSVSKVVVEVVGKALKLKHDAEEKQ